MEIKLKASTVYERINDAKKRIIVNEGSSRSTKTFSIFQWLILDHLENPKTVTTISRARLTWLKGSLIPDFQEIMKDQFDLWDERMWNKSDSIYKLNGGRIEFIGLDEVQKLHGRKQHNVWINEAVEARHKDFTQLAIRTKRKIILDYNPSYETHWIYSKVITRDDCELIHSTYKDNPFLEKEIRDEIETLEPTPYNIEQGTADETSWKIYGLGLRAAHKGLIFSKAKIVKDLPPREDWKNHFYGLDFGFTNDPTALILCVVAHGKLYFKQMIYKKGLTNRVNPEKPGQDSIEQHLIDLGIDKSDPIWGDGAEPKSIQDLANCGYNIKAAAKGQDSVNAGITTIKTYDICITEDSIDLIKERDNYKWKEDNSGELTNKPIDKWNHGWDAARYGCQSELNPSVGKFTKDYDEDSMDEETIISTNPGW